MDEGGLVKPSSGPSRESSSFQTPMGTMPKPPSRRDSATSLTGHPSGLFTAGGGATTGGGFKGRRSSILGKKTRAGMASKTNTAMKQEVVPDNKEIKVRFFLLRF